MAITCAYHKRAEIAGACVNCGKFICAECKVVLKGKIYCNPCFEEMYAEKALAAERSAPATVVVEESIAAREVTTSPKEAEAKPATLVETTAQAKESKPSKIQVAEQAPTTRTTAESEPKGLLKPWTKLVAMISGLLLAVSVFLPWLSAKEMWGEWAGISASGMVVSIIMGIVGIVAGLVVVAAGFFFTAGRRGVVQIVSGVVALVMLLIMVLNRTLPISEYAMTLAALREGFYLFIIAALVLVGIGFLERRQA